MIIMDDTIMIKHDDDGNHNMKEDFGSSTTASLQGAVVLSYLVEEG